MNITASKLIYFSPTKTTKKVVEGIAQGFQVDMVEHLDLTPPETRKGEFQELHNELVIIGAPVYGGASAKENRRRIPTIRTYGMKSTSST